MRASESSTSMEGQSRRDRSTIGNLHHRQTGTEMAGLDEKNTTSCYAYSVWNSQNALDVAGIMMKKKKVVDL